MSQQRTNDKGREMLLAASSGKIARKGGGGKGKPGGKSGKGGDGPPKRRVHFANLVPGFMLGVFLAYFSGQFGFLQIITELIPKLEGPILVPLLGVLGAVIFMTRARRLLWVLGGILCAMWIGIGYTPLIIRPAKSLIIRDRLEPVEAVLVLSSDIHASGALTMAAQTRLLKAYEILKDGHAKVLVLTRLPRPKKSYVPAVQEQMRVGGMHYPIEEVGEVASTHDEAVLVSELAKKRGWKKIIVVSDPLHMRRTKAVFAKAGLPILCAPGAAREYDLATLKLPFDRITLFRDWLWEQLGTVKYQLKGWI